MIEFIIIILAMYLIANIFNDFIYGEDFKNECNNK